MDETLVCWVFLFVATLLRLFQQGSCGRQIQKVLHSLGDPVGLLFQWYFLLIIGLSYLLLRTFYDIVIFDYVRFGFLNPAHYEPSLNASITAQLTIDPEHYPTSAAVETEITQLGLQGPIKWVSLASPVVGLLGGVLVIKNVFSFLQQTQGYRLANVDEQKDYYWATNVPINMVIMVLLTPFVFIVMAMRATLRQWAVMTGSSYMKYLHQIRDGEMPHKTWQEVKRLELATYETDLVLASFFQFCTIASFGYLCGIFLARSRYLQLDDDEDNDEETRLVKAQYRRTLQWLSIQGLFAYVIVGVARTIIDLACTVMKEYPHLESVASTWQDKGLELTSSIFTFVTIFAVINMKFIGLMKDVRDHLGANVNSKFMGTRVLLLIAQIQLKVLGALTVGSMMYEKVSTVIEEHHANLPPWLDIKNYSFGSQKAQLLHSSLLIIESVLVVAANMLMWRNVPKGLMEDLSTRSTPLLQ